MRVNPGFCLKNRQKTGRVGVPAKPGEPNDTANDTGGTVCGIGQYRARPARLEPGVRRSGVRVYP